MATQLQIRRGTSTQVAAFTGAEGEIVVNTTNDSVHVNDGSTAGGFELARADFNNISASATLTIGTLNTTNLDLTNLEVTNIKAKDGTAAGSIADSTGVITLISSSLTTADITTLKIGGTTVTSTAAELNYVDGVTSAIQTQIDAKAPIANPTFTGSFTSPGIDDNASSTAISIDSSGNVGMGLTPHNWAVGRALELGFEGNALWGNAADEVIVVQNGYYDGAWKYATTRKATHYSQYDGTHRWFYAPSGTADSAITWATAMTIDNSGNVGIGVAPTFTPGGSRKLLQVTNAANGGQISMGNNSSESENPRIFSDADNLGFATATTGGGVFQFYTGGSESMQINSSGYVGILQSSSSSISNPLHITKEIGGYQAVFDNDNGSGQGLKVRIKANDSGNFNILDLVSASTGSDVSVMTVRDDGNVLVGTTDTTLFNNTSGGGIALLASNRLDVARSGDVVATFNRTTNEGAIVQFYDRGTLSGQIGVESAGVFLGNPLNGGGLRIGGDITAPSNSSGSASNNSQDLGTSSFRWKTIYAVNALNTSDEKLKQDIEGLSDAEKRVAVALKGLVKKYRFKDEVAAQGSDAKIRVGLIAQQVVSAFDDEGLTATDYALLSHETDTDAQFNELETKTYSINYSELLAFIISAI